jgi:hypothetical protein
MTQRSQEAVTRDGCPRGLSCPCFASVHVGLALEVPICKPQGPGLDPKSSISLFTAIGACEVHKH